MFIRPTRAVDTVAAVPNDDERSSRHTVRVWLPDRPGGLGAIASRVGAVGAEIVGIEIIERDGGQAIDDLLIELPPGVGTDLLVRELSEVDGARIEDVRDTTDAPPDARLQALETARSLAESPERDVHLRLCDHVRTDTGADWAACVDLDDDVLIAAQGRLPSVSWILAYAHGTMVGGDAPAEPGDLPRGTEVDDTICLPISDPTIVLAVGRQGRAFRRRERSALALMTRLASARLASCNEAANRTH